MKKLLFIAIAVIVSFASCSDDNNEENTPNADFVKLSAERLIANPEGGNVEVTVESSGSWRVAGISDWITPVTTKGEDGESITFSTEANRSDEIWEATFKVFSGTAVQQVVIVSDPITKHQLVSKPEDFKSLSTSKQSITITFESNVPEEELTYQIVSEGEPWITIGKKNSAFGQRAVMLDVNENKTYIYRKNTLVISGKDEEISLDIWQMPVKHLSAEKKYFDIDNTAQDLEIEICTNSEYDIKNLPGWITVGNTVKGEVREDGLHIETVTLHVDAAQFTRNGTISVYYKGDYWKQFDMTIQQTNPNPITIDIENKELREALKKIGWVNILNGNTCELLEPSTSKSLNLSKSNLTSLSEIEKFPQIEELNVSDNNLEEVDITALQNVRSINVTNNSNLSSIKLGNNPIQSISDIGGFYGMLNSTTLTISGNNITEINADYKYYSADKLKELDVTGCPNLKTCNAFRGAAWGTTVYLNKIYVTAAQKDSVSFNVKDGTEIVIK